MPFSIISSEKEVVVNGEKVRGRQYSWGVAEGILEQSHFKLKTKRIVILRNCVIVRIRFNEMNE